MKKINYLFVSLICINLLIGCGNNNLDTDVTEKIAAEEKQQKEVSEEQIEETIKEESEEEVEESVKSYETLAEMKEVIIDYIQKTYPDGSVSCTSDEYNDTTYVQANDDNACTYVEKKENGYGLIIYSNLVAVNSEGKPILGFAIKISYASNSFLDYLFDSDCIFLASDGTRYNYPIYKISQYEDSLYFTDMCITFEENQREELDTLYEMCQKDELSMRIDQLNNNGEYITVDLDNTTRQNIKRGIELYYEVYDALYK